MEEVKVQKSVNPLREIHPTIYAYTTPEIERHNGWTKIGYTEAQTPQERIAQQTETADVKTILEWDEPAIYKTDPKDWFKDRHFHRFLEKEGEYARQKSERRFD